MKATYFVDMVARIIRSGLHLNPFGSFARVKVEPTAMPSGGVARKEPRRIKRICSVLVSTILAAQFAVAQTSPSVADKAAEMLTKLLKLGPGDFNAIVTDATFLLFCKTNTGISAGTGFIVDRNLDPKHPKKLQPVLLTAAHVLAPCTTDSVTIRLRYKSGDPIKWTLEDREIKLVEKNHKLWVKHPSVDVAALPLEVWEDIAKVVLPLDVIAGGEILKKELFFGRDVFALGYPYGDPGLSGFPMLRPAEVNSRDLDDANLIFLSLRIYPGDSGGPVYVTERTKDEIHVVIVGLMCQARFLVGGSAERSPGDSIGVGYMAPSTALLEAIKLLPRKEQ